MTNIEKYDKVFEESFSLEKTQLTEDLKYEQIPAWDSIGHMSMIAAIEETFDIMIETEDIIDFSSYQKGQEIVKKYGIEL